MKLLINYAMTFIGKPYIWGGEGPFGFDCSGLVQEILRSVGEDPEGDQTAQALFDYSVKNHSRISLPEMGAIIYYGRSTKEISHVALSLDDFRIIEAGGGGRNQINAQTAERVHAMVRIRPFSHRSDIMGIFMPEYTNCKKD